MWKIDKTLEFCYGHRVHTQKLNGEYSADLKSACRHLHGHEGKVQIYLESDTLDPTGMVTDFRHLEWLKKFINEYIDHQFIVDVNDPEFEYLTRDNLRTLPYVNVYVPGTYHITGQIFDMHEWGSSSQREVMEGFLIVDFVPTSENLSKWMCELTQAKMTGLGVKVAQVDWWETPKSRSTYIAD